MRPGAEGRSCGGRERRGAQGDHRAEPRPARRASQGARASTTGARVSLGRSVLRWRRAGRRSGARGSNHGGEAAMAETLEAMLARQVARFTDRTADWDAFADARIDGYRRAQHRFIGSGASGKVDASVIPAEHFTLSVMFVPPGQGNAAHTHEVEEVFFILRGKVKVFIEDGAGGRAETVLGPWDCASCPAGVIHGFVNVGLEPAYLQVMLGKARPDLMSYADPSLQQRRGEHLGLECNPT